MVVSPLAGYDLIDNCEAKVGGSAMQSLHAETRAL